MSAYWWTWKASCAPAFCSKSAGGRPASVYLKYMVLPDVIAAEPPHLPAATRDSAVAGHFNTGLVAAGKNADFIVLDANPLVNISNSRKINKVFLRGLEVDRAALRAKWQARWKTGASTR